MQPLENLKTSAMAAPEDLVRLARAIVRARRQRDALFENLFADPAWDIMLDLFIMEGAGLRATTTDACIAAAAPHTTAHRYVHLLVDRGIVQRVECSTDRRIVYLKLVEGARQNVERALRGFANLVTNAL